MFGATFHRVGHYLDHILSAHGRHGIHSPFMYDLVDRIILATCNIPGQGRIETLREQLLQDDRTIRVTDLGAGSHRNSGTERRVNEIARTSLKPSGQAALLYRLAKELPTNTVLELGTSLGITSMYLAEAVGPTRVHTVEGCPNIAALARTNFAASGMDAITSHVGAFTEMLPSILATIAPIGLVFIDGHHAKAPTLQLVDMCLPHMHEHGVLVVDDIHWSSGMSKAWVRIQKDPRVHVTADLFHFGLVYCREGQASEHFKIRMPHQ